MIAKSMTEAKRVGNLPELIKGYLLQYNIMGKMLEIGGWSESNMQGKRAEFWRLDYSNLDLKNSAVKTIIGDITNCPQIKDNTYDFIYSMDTFEHIKEPWLAAKEIIRILKPGGICGIVTLFSWRYHECPIDYWRYSPQCLVFLFKDLDCLEANWDSRNRRGNIQGHGEANDIVPEDELGAFRENWRVYYIGRKR